jgi:hypothetical protein
MAKYIVMTNGRGYGDGSGFEVKSNRGSDELTMDVRAEWGRRPISLGTAKQRAAHIVSTESGVKAYICKVEYVAERQPVPVIIRELTDEKD